MRNQQWSKVKKKLDSFICDSLKNRVQFTVTNYRKAHDQLGRAFITVDKKEILNMCTITSDIEMYRKENEIRNAQSIEYDVYNGHQNYQIGIQAHEMIKAEGFFAQYDFFDAVEEYFNLPIEKALKSDDMVIKILSLVDRRVGKRTLEGMKESIQNEKEIIQYFYNLRCEADRIMKLYKKFR
ncbi:SF0329 family protein [Peribacillus sp. NPDC006672]|uniref:SF0329 family protein n=1 Tax=Peribacillus sp. NPDC006672 TaxID=3390606 RepID=UPI003D03E977